jgi:hypothetical protein
MLTIISCIGLVIIFVTIHEIHHKIKYKSYDLDIGLITIFILLSFVIGSCIALVLPEDHRYKKFITQEIVTLRDNKSHIKYFLYSSASTMEYTFYVKNNDYFEMQRLDYSCVRIKYTKGKPKIEKYKEVKTDASINYWAIDTEYHDEYYVIYVPDGTIKTELMLDAQ